MQVSLAIFLLIGILVLLTLFLNSRYLNRYYEAQKRGALRDMYSQLRDAASGGTLSSDEFDRHLIELTEKENIELIIMDAESRTVKAYATDRQAVQGRLLQNILQQREAGSAHVISTENGITLQTVQDKPYGSEHMELWGILPDGSLFLLRTALESMRNSSAIANRFLLLTGLCTALLGAVLAFIVGTRLTRPVRELTDISERMMQMDFSSKFHGSESNEIGELGRNFNELSAKLEETISELKTANNRLKSDIRKKEEIEEMRQEFIANLTHEFKTPIAVIQGYAEGLIDNVNGDEESRNAYCEVIVDEAQKMNGMVQRLLTLNQLEFGKMQPDMERFDVTDMIKGYLETVDVLIKQQEITLLADLTEPAFVWSDPYMTQEVFANYFTNAMHHVKREKRIEIRLVRTGEKIRIGVFNTGDPIPQDSVPRIWEKFYKVDKAHTREYGGSGVGLSIVKAIMERLHEQYGVTNFENGVLFWFELEAA